MPGTFKVKVPGSLWSTAMHMKESCGVPLYKPGQISSHFIILLFVQIIKNQNKTKNVPQILFWLAMTKILKYLEGSSIKADLYKCHFPAKSLCTSQIHIQFKNWNQAFLYTKSHCFSLKSVVSCAFSVTCYNSSKPVFLMPSNFFSYLELRLGPEVSWCLHILRIYFIFLIQKTVVIGIAEKQRRQCGFS